MKVILLKDVKGTGRKDQVLDISEGFARNFLLPRRLAVLASGQALSALEKEHWRKSQKETAEIKKADVLLDRLASQPLKFVLPADQKGHLYAGLKDSEILVKLAKGESPLTLVEYSPIKTVGEHEISVKIAKLNKIKKIKVIIEGK